MSLELVIIALVCTFLRKRLNTAVTMPEWHKKLTWLMYGSFALIALQYTSSLSHSIIQWVSLALLGYLLYVIYTNNEFKAQRFLVTAIVPFLIVSFITESIKLISKDFFNKWSDQLDTANTFAVIWGLGTWFLTQRQRKALVKAEEKVQEEEQKNIITSAMKAELEVQVAERTAELTKQKEELLLTLDELKSTQAQLIQSEKMASLGELTAGIAHEIQNPLNFVSNFSDVNNELIDEMLVEISNNNIEEVNHIVNDIKENNSKIIFHGKRADAIVKGMLQHSRKNTGQKEEADINALCDEYLRLSYHGLRAKDKSFNASMNTDFDSSIEKINIVPQDVGRVLLNLFNNAFYAVTEKKKTADETYKPVVSVQTKKVNDEVEIVIKDNGSGIPQSVIDKIFQPFFTTKPTGQGTGLGLSMSYDIITKEHNGTITVESKENEGTAFEIKLPALA